MANSSSVLMSPAKKLETNSVNNLEHLFSEFLNTVVIGQAEGKAMVTRAFRRTLSKLRIKRTPLGAYILLGPTSCGKTELVYRFVEWLHGDRRCLLKIDGSEYQQDGELTKLKGATNMWTGRVNKKSDSYVPLLPHEKDETCELSRHNIEVYALHLATKGCNKAVILVDEWDKACKDFNDIWLSILRDGIYTNGAGEVIDFTNTIIFFTGNLGSAAVEAEADKRKKGGMGFTSQVSELSKEEADKMMTKHLKEFASPEFRARINELGGVVFCHALSTEQVFEVCGVKVRETKAFAKDSADIELIIGDDVKHWLLKRADNELSSVNGALATCVVDVLDNELIKSAIGTGDTVEFTAESVDAAELIVTRLERPALVIPSSIEEALALTDLAAASCGLVPGGATLPLRMDELDEETAKNFSAGRLRQARVTKDSASAPPAEPKQQDEKIKPEGRVFQPFCLTLVLADDAALTKMRAKLLELAPKYNFNKVHEEIDPVTVKTKTGETQAIMLKTHVTGLIEYMMELSKLLPLMKIKVQELEIKA